MKRLKVKKQAKKRIYVHNDLSNAAFHFRERIEEMHVSGNREGIGLEIIACLAMLAFTFEAKVNFIGSKAVKGWKERKSFKDKIKDISSAIDYTPDKSKRPYRTILELKSIRDSFAHGKPVEVELDETVEVTEEELNQKLYLGSEWESKLTVEFVRHCSEDIDAIWKEWLKLARIELFETLTRSEYDLTVIKKYADAET